MESADARYEYKCTLTVSSLQRAQAELGEDPITRMLELKAFRDRLLQYPGLRARTDPQFLIRFLRARKFDQERAFELIINFYRMQKNNQKVFTGLKPSHVMAVLENAVSYPLDVLDRSGRRLCMFFPGRIDFSRYTMDEVFKAEYLNLSKLLEDEEVQVNGLTILADYTGYTKTHLFKASTDVDVAKRFVSLWQDAFPARLKAVIIINEPVFLDVLFAFFSPFMKEKLLRRFHRLGTDWSKLHEFIDPQHLPSEYGGTLSTGLSNKKWLDQMMQSEDEMGEQSKFGFVDFTLQADDNKSRTGKRDAISNMAGTFKKLDVQ